MLPKILLCGLVIPVCGSIIFITSIRNSSKKVPFLDLHWEFQGHSFFRILGGLGGSRSVVQIILHQPDSMDSILSSRSKLWSLFFEDILITSNLRSIFYVFLLVLFSYPFFRLSDFFLCTILRSFFSSFFVFPVYRWSGIPIFQAFGIPIQNLCRVGTQVGIPV